MWCFLFLPRCRYLLQLVCPWGREAWLSSEEKQGGSDHWAGALGGLPSEGRGTHCNTVSTWTVLTCCILPPVRLQLGKDSYLAGPSFSLADATVFPTVATLFRFGSVGEGWVFYPAKNASTFQQHQHSNVRCVVCRRLSAERYPGLGQYHALVKERPSVKASWPPHWLENPNGQETLKDIWHSHVPVMVFV